MICLAGVYPPAVLGQYQLCSGPRERGCAREVLLTDRAEELLGVKLPIKLAARSDFPD